MRQCDPQFMLKIVISISIVVGHSFAEQQQNQLCQVKKASMLSSTVFKSRKISARNEKIRSHEESLKELGSVDVLISHCTGAIHPTPFNFLDFQCISGLKFWVYEKCSASYFPPPHLQNCICTVPVNHFTGLSGTLFSHI